jgi:hypothetical protein
MISVVVLQNGMDLLGGELGSSAETCVTSTVVGKEVTGVEAERVSYIKKEEDEEPMTIPEIKMEPKVSFVAVVSVCTFLIGCVQNCLFLYQRVLVKQILTLGNGFRAVFKKRNLYFVTHCMCSTACIHQ